MRFSRRTLVTASTILVGASAKRPTATSAFAKHFGTTTQRNSNSAAMATNTSTLNARVGLLQFPVSEDKTANHDMASKYLARAAEQHVQLAVLPEIWNSPYATAAFRAYAEVLPEIGATDVGASPSATLLQQHAMASKMWIVGGSIPEIDGADIYNTCLVFDPDGMVVAKHRKMHLFDIDVPGGIRFKESDTLSPGNTLSAFRCGDFGMVGVGICYDMRFPEYALLLNQQHQCNMLIYPGAFNLTTGPAHWELLQRGRAVDNQCYVLTASPARVAAPETPGAYPHYTAWGHSTVVSPWGEVVATCDEHEALVVADLDMSKVATMRQSIPVLQQKRLDVYKLEKSPQ
jgi:omega-amidase